MAEKNIFNGKSKLIEKREWVYRQAGLLDFSVFLKTIADKWGLEPKRLKENVVELPMAASQYFLMEFPKLSVFNQPVGEAIRKQTNPAIASNRPFFYLLNWGDIVWIDNENRRLIFKENIASNNGIRFSIKVDGEEKWNALTQTGKLDLRKTMSDKQGIVMLSSEHTFIIKPM